MIEAPFHGNVIEFLKAQPYYPKVFWNGRAAFGAAKIYDTIPETDERVWGGIDFPLKRKTSLWDDFPEIGFFKPRGEIFRKNGKWILRVEEGMTLLRETPCLELPPLIEIANTPTYEAWQSRLETNLEAIKRGELEKIVTARQTDFTFTQEIDPYRVLKNLPDNTGTRFLFQFSEGSAFCGTTPELLYERTGNKVLSHAIAGTRSRGMDEEEDASLKKELLNSDKELREFEFVREMIEGKLKKVCQATTVSPLEVLQTEHVQHLFQKIEGILHQQNDASLINLLHPTPATCGLPCAQSLSTLFQDETFDRGWYSAPIGYIEKDHARFMVALRSMLIRKNQAHIYAGTGIVQGSNPTNEWNELEIKIKTAVNSLINSHSHVSVFGNVWESTS
ncbi:MAG: Isochorismate synthase MenF [Chlamydiia bacterium]|nr:Isochorismate synthase MenF [Chlamydiia bacterium]MCH9615424.1 Isochorismate synthase MenF [Chlamydiia bacterium]MCH9628254.1 Isochorismate synthase MenF [Chlamydiia bacterium]